MNSEAESYLPHLYQLLMQRFDQEELADICFRLNISYDDLRGESRPGKARELLLLMARRDKLPALLETLRQVRREAEWPPVPAGFSNENLQTAAEIERFQSTARRPESPAAAPQFNISGQIQAGKVNIGGTETIQGDQHINLDFSESDDDAGRNGDDQSGS